MIASDPELEQTKIEGERRLATQEKLEREREQTNRSEEAPAP
jgi:hypothetical protein